MENGVKNTGISSVAKSWSFGRERKYLGYGRIPLPLILNIDYVNMQHNYVQKRLINVIIHHNYVDMQHYYVDMRDSYVNMRLFIMLHGNIIMSHVDMNNSLVNFFFIFEFQIQTCALGIQIDIDSSVL